MIISGLFSFLGGSAFRAILGEFSSWWTAKQDHKHEMEMMQAQALLDDKAHAREMEKMRLANELNIKQVEIKSDADIAMQDAESFTAAMKTINAKSGIKWIDGFNALIRPLCASVALMLWVMALNGQGFTLTEWDRELVGAIIGFWFAHRIYKK